MYYMSKTRKYDTNSLEQLLYIFMNVNWLSSLFQN